MPKRKERLTEGKKSLKYLKKDKRHFKTRR